MVNGLRFSAVLPEPNQVNPLTSPRGNLPFTEAPSSLHLAEARMRLRAVRSRSEVVDFTWDFASESAAALLRCRPVVLNGRTLRAWQDAGPRGQPPLLDRYRRILDQRRTQSFDHVHEVDRRQDVVIHRVVCEGDGVAVTLINLSANRRAQALRLRVEDSPVSQRSDRR
jgi:hypothetical protein